MVRLFISYKTVLQAIKRCTNPDDIRNRKLGLVDLQINSNTDCIIIRMHKRVNYSISWDKINLHWVVAYWRAEESVNYK